MGKTIYLVTGAAGFLGSHVCDELLERGDQVQALVLPGDKSVKYVPQAVEIVEGNLCDVESLEAFFTVPDGCRTIVIHCASMVTTNPDFNQKLIDVNVGGTKNVIELCLAHPECEKMVYVSSTGAIPELPRGTKITETDRFTPVDDKRQVGCYSQSKAMATQEVLDACKNRGLNACVVHPSGILGPKDYAISETTGTIIKIMNGEMTIGMGGSFNLCDVRDLAHGCVGAADHGRAGECYILGNKEVTLKEVCRMLHDASGCKMPLFYVPVSMAYLLAAQMEKKAAKTGEKPLMTNFAVYNLARNNEFDYSKAERELGYHTRPYAETLRDEAEWLVAEGYIKGAVVKPQAVPAEAPEHGVLTHDEVAGIKKLMDGRELVNAVAAVTSVAELDKLMAGHGVTGYTQKMLDECYAAIAMSQDWETVQGLLQDRNFEQVSAKLAEHGVATTRENFDLINDIVAIACDETLNKQSMAEMSVSKTVELLRAKGYTAITPQFIAILRDNAAHLVEDGVLSREDVGPLVGHNFFDRCHSALNTLMAMSAITELKLHLEGAVNPAYMIAIAGGVSLAY